MAWCLIAVKHIDHVSGRHQCACTYAFAFTREASTGEGDLVGSKDDAFKTTSVRLFDRVRIDEF